jgi:hypothetical protein
MTSSSPGCAYCTAIRARCPLSRAGKEIILTMTRPMSGWTQSFPRTWMTPRCAGASIPRRAGPYASAQPTHAVRPASPAIGRPAPRVGVPSTAPSDWWALGEERSGSGDRCTMDALQQQHDIVTAVRSTEWGVGDFAYLESTIWSWWTRTAPVEPMDQLAAQYRGTAGGCLVQVQSGEPAQ